MAIRYTPTPVPQDDNQPLRQWLDDNNRRIVAAQPRQEIDAFALLFEGAADVVANDVSETAIVNYNDSTALESVLAVDAALGTITFPNKGGLAKVTSWVTLNQVTVSRNLTVQLRLEVNGAWELMGSAYIPQIATDVDIGITANLTREVAGGEVLRWGLLLDGAALATFNIVNCSFEVQYLTVRG